ncbi:hypothetical protein FOZ63_025491 [Perkinsus olseni]|uniref:Uncharacterized protein n=1 Tax=Perkinsus olseni TaxID=32597 RepID=A0A7J6SF43_PEROL|nr:hypothetical protein FOZ62_020443 [Perkinsus olseni]KAF4731172.1 hypothetical protein FOZ63_025491 [Perkinsus olseni]
MFFSIDINIALLHIVIASYTDAFSGNDTVANPRQVPVLRSLRLPVAYEEPPNCLPPAENFQGKNYCWYILQGDTQVHAGTLIPGNVPGGLGRGYVTLELIAVYSNPSARDVGVWAEGFTALHLNLEFGIELYLFFNVPRFAKVGGVDAGDVKQLKFPASLLTVVDVPCWGRVAATVVGLANAAVHKTDKYSRLQVYLKAVGERGYQSSTISLYVDIMSNADGDWRFEAIVGAQIRASNPEAKPQSLSDDVPQCPPVDYGHHDTILYDSGSSIHCGPDIVSASMI